jgi:hypothetical protein
LNDRNPPEAALLRQSNARYALFLAALLAGPAQAATTYTWPGAAPCAGTLQACIDAASDGDRVEIATAGPITENIAMHSRSLTIAAAYGYSPLFSNAGILADSTSGSADMQVGISGLRFSHGFVTVNYFGTGTALSTCANSSSTTCPAPPAAVCR